MIGLVIGALALVGAIVHIVISRQPRTTPRVLEILLTWAFAYTGIVGILTFYAHVFDGPATAKLIGWPPGNPFQFEVGISDLGLGVLGLVSIWRRRGDFWLASIIMMTVFYWGASVGHVIQIVQFNNFAPGNAGIVLYADIATPLILIGLFSAYKLTAGRQQITMAEQGRRAA